MLFVGKLPKSAGLNPLAARGQAGPYHNLLDLFGRLCLLYTYNWLGIRKKHSCDWQVEFFLCAWLRQENIAKETTVLSKYFKKCTNRLFIIACEILYNQWKQSISWIIRYFHLLCQSSKQVMHRAGLLGHLVHSYCISLWCPSL